jgi:hypothetical protein
VYTLEPPPFSAFSTASSFMVGDQAGAHISAVRGISRAFPVLGSTR